MLPSSLSEAWTLSSSVLVPGSSSLPTPGASASQPWKAKKKGRSELLMCPRVSFPHLPLQLGPEASVFHPCSSLGPTFFSCIHITESFPQVFFLRVLFLLELKFPTQPFMSASADHLLTCSKDFQNYLLFDY